MKIKEYKSHHNKDFVYFAFKILQIRIYLLLNNMLLDKTLWSIFSDIF